MAATTPSPAEAPKNISELNDAAKQTSFIDELVKSHGLTEPEKKQFSEKYSKAIKELSDRYADKKDIVITEIGEILKTFKDSLQHEKSDDDDATEFTSATPDTDKADTDAEKKLGGQEIDDHIKQLSAKIEAKLNAPTIAKPEEPATAPKQAIMATLGELNISADIPPLPNDYVSTNKPNWMIAAITKFLEAAGLGFLANFLKMQTIGYKSERQMEYTKNAMTTLLSIKESPLSSIIRLDDITEREFREVLTTHGDIDLSVKENAEAALLGLHADNPKYEKYHRIYLGIEDMAKNMTGTDSIAYNPKTRFDNLLNYSKKKEFSPDYTPIQNTPVLVSAPLSETEIRAEEEKQKLSELEEAAKADKELADAIQGHPTGDPEIADAQDNLDKIKNVSKDRIIASIKTAENRGAQSERELKIAELAESKAETIHIASQKPQDKIILDASKERMKQIQAQILNCKNAVSAIEKIAKDLIDGPLPNNRTTWVMKKGISAQASVEWAQKSEEEVKKIDELTAANKDAEVQTMTEQEKKDAEKEVTKTKILELAGKTGKLSSLTNEKIDPEENIKEAEESLKEIQSDTNYVKFENQLGDIRKIIERARSKFDLMQLIKERIKDKIGEIDWDDLNNDWVDIEDEGGENDTIEFDIKSWHGAAFDFVALRKGEDQDTVNKFNSMSEILTVIKNNKDYLKGAQAEPKAPPENKVDVGLILSALT